MDMQKIGAFIAACRKEKGMTQAQLGEMLGVTNKTISRWENGHYMPDLSMLAPLSEALGISLNELLAGERLHEDAPVETMNLSTKNAIEYGEQLLSRLRRWVCVMLLVLGGASVLMGLDAAGGLAAFLLALGWLMLALAAWFRLRGSKAVKKLLCAFLLALAASASFLYFDYKMVTVYEEVPRISRCEVSADRPIVAYKTPFYTAYKVNNGARHAYMIVDTKHRYTIDTVPVSPFDRTTSGIEALLKFKSAYVGDNSNTGHLFGALPLAEDGFVFEIDPEHCGVTVDYHRTAWYSNDDHYVEKALVYNSVAAFLLIDNLDAFTANFSGASVTVTRAELAKHYPHYDTLVKDGAIDTAAFDKVVEAKMNDTAFATRTFVQLFGAPLA